MGLLPRFGALLVWSYCIAHESDVFDLASAAHQDGVSHSSPTPLDAGRQPLFAHMAAFPPSTLPVDARATLVSLPAGPDAGRAKVTVGGGTGRMAPGGTIGERLRLRVRVRTCRLLCMS